MERWARVHASVFNIFVVMPMYNIPLRDALKLCFEMLLLFFIIMVYNYLLWPHRGLYVFDFGSSGTVCNRTSTGRLDGLPRLVPFMFLTSQR